MTAIRGRRAYGDSTQRRAAGRAARLRPVAPAPRLWREDRLRHRRPGRPRPLRDGLARGAGKIRSGRRRLRLALARRRKRAPRASTPGSIRPPIPEARPSSCRCKTAPGRCATITAPVGSTIIVRAVNAADLRVAVHGGIKPPAEPTANHDDASREQRFRCSATGACGSPWARRKFAHFRPAQAIARPASDDHAARRAPKANLRGSFALAYRIEDDYGARDAQVLRQASSRETCADGHALRSRSRRADRSNCRRAPGGLGEGASTSSTGATAPMPAPGRSDPAGARRGRAMRAGGHQPFRPARQSFHQSSRARARRATANSLPRRRRKDKVLAGHRRPDARRLKFSRPVPASISGFASSMTRFATPAATPIWSRSPTCFGKWPCTSRKATSHKPNVTSRRRNRPCGTRSGTAPRSEEIARLTEHLQKALDRFLAAMRERAAKQDQARESETGDGRLVTPKDFKSMLDRWRKRPGRATRTPPCACSTGCRTCSKISRNGRPQGRPGGAHRRTMRDIDNMMREQQKLRDDTFARDRASRAVSGAQELGAAAYQPGTAGRSGSRPEWSRPGDAGASRRTGPASEAIASKARFPQGAGPGRRGREIRGPGGGGGSHETGGKRAARRRQSLRFERAGPRPGGIAKRSRRSRGAGRRNGPSGEGDETGRRNGQGYEGRNGEGDFGDTNRQRKIDPTATQRARKVLEELRRRLADPNRAREELDYLERLIRPD